MTSEWIRGHLYLATTLWGLVTVALCWLFAGPQRRMMLAAGAIIVPFFPLAAIFNDGSYWSPSHVEIGSLLPIRAFGGPVGIEDLLFLFIAGTRTWFCATVPTRGWWSATARPSDFLRRAVVMTAIALACLALVRFLGVGYTAASYVLPAAFGAVLLLSDRDRWPLALSGAIGSAALSGIELLIWFSLWPAWRSAWSPDAATSQVLLGITIGDLLWWGVVGAVHPLALAHCAGVVRVPARRKPTRGSWPAPHRDGVP